MSLIMDALEKVQRETKPLSAKPSGLVMDRPQPSRAVKPIEAFVRNREEEAIPIRRGRVVLVVLFAGLLFAAAVLGFQKMSAGLSLPQMPDSTAAVLPVMPVPIVPQVAGPGILRGVLQDPAGSYCILGDQILKIGDTWQGYTVLSIEAQQVVVQDTQNHLLTLHLQEL